MSNSQKYIFVISILNIIGGVFYLIRKFLGHSDVQTSWGYIVDIDAEKEDREKTVEALKDFGLNTGGNITPFRKTS